VYHREVESAAVVERPSCTAETEVGAQIIANAVAEDPVQRIDKDSLVNIKKLHAPSAGMKCTFDAICMMFGPAPHRVEGVIPGLNEDNYWLEDVLLLNDVQFVKNVNNFKIETLTASRTGLNR
jgi:hypothetical protein